MIGILVENTWLDLFPDTRIQIKRNTDLYVTGDPEFASNSYSLPFTIPTTGKNRLALRYPEEIETVDYRDTDIQAIIYAGEGSSIGLPIFHGKLYVKKSSKKFLSASQIEVFIVVDGLNNFTSVKMADLPWELYQLDTAEDMAEHAKDTVENPDDYDYIFAQIMNTSFYDGEKEVVGPQGTWTNYFNRTTQVFTAESPTYDGLVMTPFYKTKVVFQKIIEYMGYAIEDNFHTLDPELGRLLFFNNKNMYKIEEGGQKLDTVIDGTRHMVDKMSITDFVKKICRFFCLGIFVNNDHKKIQITPFKDVINQPDAANWTAKVIPDYDIDKTDTVLPAYIGVKVDGSDELSQLAIYKDISEYGPATEYFNGTPATPAFYYFARANQYWYIKNAEDYKLVTNHFERIWTNGKGSPVELSVSPTLMTIVYSTSQRGVPYGGIHYPQVGIKGSGEKKEKDENGDWTIINTQSYEHTDIRLFFYRGMFTNPLGKFVQSGITATDEESQAYAYQYSLLFNGQNSVYERFWKEWIYFMKYKKIVRMMLNLKLADILSFREYHKIRIGGISYFVKSMDITLTMQGIEPVQAELISIPFS